jgi:hypothetical protein
LRSKWPLLPTKSGISLLRAVVRCARIAFRPAKPRSIEAPIDIVERHVRAFGQYKDLAPGKFRTSRIVDKTETTTDVYMQITIMKGFVTLWEIMRFGSTQAPTPEVRTIEGTYVKGNLKASHVVFVMRKVSDKRTILKADVLISLEVPAPEELVDEELRDYSADAVAGLREKSQAAARAAQAP